MDFSCDGVATCTVSIEIECLPICTFISGKGDSCGLFTLFPEVDRRFFRDELCFRTFKNGCRSLRVKLLFRIARPDTLDLASGIIISFKSLAERALSKVIHPIKGGRFDISDTI